MHVVCGEVISTDGDQPDPGPTVSFATPLREQEPPLPWCTGSGLDEGRGGEVRGARGAREGMRRGENDRRRVGGF